LEGGAITFITINAAYHAGSTEFGSYLEVQISNFSVSFSKATANRGELIPIQYFTRGSNAI
jgi:hypothetical protein